MVDAPVPPLIDRILDVLDDGPLTVPALVERLAPAPAEDVTASLADLRIVGLADDRVASGVALCRGWTARHRLSADEVAARAVRLDDDVLAPVACAPDPMVVVVGTHAVALRAQLDAEGDEDHDLDPVVDLPAGWHPELAEGDVVGLRLEDDGRLELVAGELDAVDPDAPADEDITTAVAAALVAEGEAHGFRLRVVEAPADGSEGGWVADAVLAVTALVADHRDLVAGLRRPLTEVYAAAGMHHGAALLAAPGVSEHQLRLFQVGYDILGGPHMPRDHAEVAEALGMAWMLLLGAGVDEVSDDLQVRAIASVLAEPFTTTALADHLRSVPADEVAAMVPRLEAVALAAPEAPGPAHLLTEAAVIAGSPGPVLPVLGAALAGADPDEWTDAFECLGHLRAVAGDMAGAARVFQALDDPEAVEFLQRWRVGVAAGVGRNDRCPCGSGRKYKQCCLDRPRSAPLDDRIELLWWKAQTWCLKDRFEVMPWSDAVDGVEAEPLTFLAADCHLVEDSALAAFTVELGSLLPDDEATLVETWLERPRRLWAVVAADAAGAELRDLSGAGEVTAVRPLADSPLDPGALVLATAVPTGGEREAVVGKVVEVPAGHRDAALALLADHPGGQEVLDWSLALALAGP